MLVLIGNPLKILRRRDTLDFISKNLACGLPLNLALPGPAGFQGGAVSLCTREIIAAARRSRFELRVALENVLDRLQSHQCVSYVMEHTGNNLGLPTNPIHPDDLI
jgi:hypothetical protein